MKRIYDDYEKHTLAWFLKIAQAGGGGGRTWELFSFNLFYLTSNALDHSAAATPSFFLLFSYNVDDVATKSTALIKIGRLVFPASSNAKRSSGEKSLKQTICSHEETTQESSTTWLLQKPLQLGDFLDTVKMRDRSSFISELLLHIFIILRAHGESSIF